MTLPAVLWLVLPSKSRQLRTPRGNPAHRLQPEHLDAVNRRTTVVILGDGRNNGKDPNPAALAQIAERARSTLWMTPEPRWSWKLGSSDMPLYETLVDRVELVRTVDGLARMAERLVRTGQGAARR